ncbi:MAG: hypothetical protein B7X76_02215, partial [Azorhizobium sp. 39-67-5]
MKISLSRSPLALTAALCASLTLALPQGARADYPPVTDTTVSGSYLAARVATAERDTDAAVAYLRALLKMDPRNEEILERAFFAMLVDGDLDNAVPLAERLVKLDRSHRIARLVLAARAIKKNEYQRARTNLSLSVRGPIGDLTATLIAAWTMLGSGNSKAGVEMIDRLQGPDWYSAFKDLNAGLILDAAGQKKEAGKRLEAAMKFDPASVRAVDAYGRWASRNANAATAIEAYEAFLKVVPRHPLAQAAIADLKAGKSLPVLIKTPQEGAAEVLYGLGAALARMPVWSWSLAAQFICFTLLAVAVSLAMVFMISWDEHGQAMRKVAKAEMISRCASLVRVLEATPPGLQDDILTASNTSASRYWVSDHGPGNAAEWRANAWSHLTQPLARAQLPGHPNLPALESRLEAPRNIAEAGSPDWIEMPAYAASLDRALKFQYLDDSTGMGISVPLRNG